MNGNFEETMRFMEVLHEKGVGTVAEALIISQVAREQNNPPTLAGIVNALNMPFSTASRVVWALTPEGGDVGILAYRPHPKDRRKKLVVVLPKVWAKWFPRLPLEHLARKEDAAS